MKLEICLITLGGGPTPNRDILRILTHLCHRVHWVCTSVYPDEIRLPSNVIVHEIQHRPSSRTLTRLLRYFQFQMNTTLRVALLQDRIQLYLFFMGGEGMVIPAAYLKLSGKRTVLMPGGWAHKVMEAMQDEMALPFRVLMQLTFKLMHYVFIYSESLAREVDFLPRRKMKVAYKHFVDFDRFSYQTEVASRELFIGYAGRLSGEKGIIGLVKAAVVCNRRNERVRLIVAGHGPLKEEVEMWRISHPSAIMYLGHLSHEKIPEFMNRLKLLVIPSTTEGIPNVMLEAMACGTPVLASPVGGIPDFVTDSETGFLLNSMKPEKMADQILSIVLDGVLLDEVSKNAQKKVRECFSFERILTKWKSLLDGILK